MICRRRATRSARSRVSASGSGRIAGLVATTKRAITAASIGSVFARLPRASANARTCAGLTTITGKPAAPRLAATTVSNPPVASTATALTPSGAIFAISASNPSALRATAKLSPAGCTCTSNRSFETSIPTAMASIFTPPCTIGLRFTRPKRLFGFDGTADGEPCSPRALQAPGGIGLPSATAPPILADAAVPKLQGEGLCLARDIGASAALGISPLPLRERDARRGVKTCGDAGEGSPLRRHFFHWVAQHVAAAPDGFDVVVTVRRRRKLLAQLADEDVDDLELGLVHAAIEMIEEHLLGQRRALPERKELEHLIFLARQVHAAAVDFDGFRIEIDGKLTGRDHRLGMTLRTAHDGLDAGDEFVLVKRLRHIVVGAEAERFDFRFDDGIARQDQDRRLHLRETQRFQNFETA